MSYAIQGVNTQDTTTAIGFVLGQGHVDDDGKEWRYVLAGSAITANQCVFVDEAFSGVPITTVLGTYGGLVGVPAVAIASGSYGWVQTFGNCLVNVAASCAADVRINTTATAGRLDDDGTAGAKVINGIKLNVAATGAADTSAFLQRLNVGATL